MNNKILTVSYGTFSCTLEGFDDSFGTMKAIAEYFRDLASDDRYFGAEPPQPDAEMLTRIAEREISRRVEARQHDGRIVLSATDAQQPDALPAAAPAAAVAAAHLAEDATAPADDTAPVAEVADAPDEIEAAPEAETEIAADAPTEVEAESAAPEVASEPDVVFDKASDEAETPEEVTDTSEEATDAVGNTDTPFEAEAFFAASESDTDAMADTSEEDTIVEAETVEAAPQDMPADSIAAKLQRIRAVVSQSQQDSSEDEMFEDEHAEEVATPESAFAISEDVAEDEDASDDVIADAARDIEEALDADDAAIAHQDDEAADEDDDVTAMLARFDTDTTAEAGTADEAVSDDDQVEAQSDDDMGLDSLAALMAADEGDTDASETGENLFDEAEETDDSVADEAEQNPRRARVIKVKRADIDAALASGQLEQVEDDDDEAETSLSEQEEAELLAELAEVEAELPAENEAEPEVAVDSDEDDIAEEVEDDEAAEVGAESEDDDIADEVDDLTEAEEDVTAVAAESKSQNVQDDDVSRLMAEAENQMEEPEGSNRRDAFAHLKAAVKAKKADSDIGNDSIKDEDAFRSDLAEVVKPRRPEVSASRGDRPESARPAPLKLVAEQRVDVDMGPKGPVRPRRVAAPQEVGQDAQDADSFAEYVAELGAHDLPALLEAAASYLSFVEGRDQFSRPQLMTKVRQVEKEDFSREDGLRSFGQLLRSGKIEKISGGRFAVTSDIGYRPEQRAAG
ncbi:hypothetical protein ACERZ8_19305 [Tateyamaria armeniaca]|uniref:Chemotaxis protein CheA n=1 Tax=Tateyamaria armeniaca TaxID=2518930 RepID=A0ABW8UYB1_9RHOB